MTFDFVRFGSEIKLTKKLCVRLCSMTEQNRIQLFDKVQILKFRSILFCFKKIKFTTWLLGIIKINELTLSLLESNFKMINNVALTLK